MFSVSEIEMIKSSSDKIERLGTLPEDILQIIYDHKLFKLFVPNELGGKDLELPEALKVFQEASSIDGSFGWLVTIGSGGNMFIPCFDKNVCEALFRPANAVIAGSGYPTGTAVKIGDVYQVSGEWKYCSGSEYASFFTANCLVKENGSAAADHIISCILMPEDVKIIQDWDAFGLKGTGSHSIKADTVKIPESRTFTLLQHKNSYGGLVHSFPFLPFSEASFTAVCLGIGQDFLRETKVSSSRKKEIWSTHHEERYENVTNLIEEQAKLFQEKEEVFYTLIEELWHKHKANNELTQQDLQEFTQFCKSCVNVLIDGANSLIRYFGMEAVKESSTLNRIWRNLYTAGQHGFLTP